MDILVLITMSSIALALVAVLLLGIGAPQRFVSDTLNKRANERWAAQMQIESSELPQMLASANAYRRARGMPEVTIEHFQRKAAHQQRALVRQAERYAASKGSRGAAASS